MDTPIEPSKRLCQVVPHPAGGLTLAVPIGGGSTIRIYRGQFMPLRRHRLTRRAAR